MVEIDCESFSPTMILEPRASSVRLGIVIYRLRRYSVAAGKMEALFARRSWRMAVTTDHENFFPIVSPSDLLSLPCSDPIGDG